MKSYAARPVQTNRTNEREPMSTIFFSVDALAEIANCSASAYGHSDHPDTRGIYRERLVDACETLARYSDANAQAHNSTTYPRGRLPVKGHTALAIREEALRRSAVQQPRGASRVMRLLPYNAIGRIDYLTPEVKGDLLRIALDLLQKLERLEEATSR